MSRRLVCAYCDRYLGTVREGTLSKALVVHCTSCAPKKDNSSQFEIPDFLRWLKKDKP